MPALFDQDFDSPAILPEHVRPAWPSLSVSANPAGRSTPGAKPADRLGRHCASPSASDRQSATSAPCSAMPMAMPRPMPRASAGYQGDSAGQVKSSFALKGHSSVGTHMVNADSLIHPSSSFSRTASINWSNKRSTSSRVPRQAGKPTGPRTTAFGENTLFDQQYFSTPGRLKARLHRTSADNGSDRR